MDISGTYLGCEMTTAMEEFSDCSSPYVSPEVSPVKQCLSPLYMDKEQDFFWEMGEAVLKSEATGRLTPIVKEELRWRIRNRRRYSSSGDESLAQLDESYESKPDEETDTVPEEAERKRRRREQNRVASRKFREKKKSQLDAMLLDYQKTKTLNRELLKRIDKLESEKKVLEKCVEMKIFDDDTVTSPTNSQTHAPPTCRDCIFCNGSMMSFL